MAIVKDENERRQKAMKVFRISCSGFFNHRIFNCNDCATGCSEMSFDSCQNFRRRAGNNWVLTILPSNAKGTIEGLSVTKLVRKDWKEPGFAGRRAFEPCALT